MKQSLKRVFSLFLAMAMLLSILPGFALTAGAEDAGGVFVLADSIEPGKTYVIVSDGKYAMTNQTVAAPRGYSGSDTTLAAVEVTVEGGILTSPVDDSMLWSFTDVSGFTAIDGEKVYYLNDNAGHFVRRGSMSQGNAALILEDSVNTTQRYFTWTVKPYAELDSTYALYLNSERSYGTDYAAYVFGGEFNSTLCFDIPDGQAQRSESDPFAFMSSDNCSKITFYELTEGGSITSTIDFSKEADNGKYEIVGKSAAVQGENGLTVKTTRNAIEDCKGQNEGEQANTPEDLIEVPVDGDWTATLHFAFDPADASNGYYQFFGFFASQGDDYQNMAGIRCGDKALQDFLRVDGTITADTDDVVSAPGLSEACEIYLQIVKEGSSYTCLRSDDGSTFSEMFTYTDSGIDASKLVIDAYTGRTTGYAYTLKTLTIVTTLSLCDHEYEDSTVAPTCTEKGYTLHTCSKCGKTYKSDYVDALGHTYPTGEDTVVPPTCTEQGYTARVCSRCGETGKFDLVDALGHEFKDFVVTKQPTETERGERTAKCTRCDATKTYPVAAGYEKPHQDEILFISDVHSARKAKDGFHNLRAVFRLLRENDNFIPEVVCGGGDYIESSTNDTVDWFECYEWLHNYIYEGAPDTYQALTSGNHEWEFSQQSDAMVERLLGQPRVCNSYNSEHFTVFQIGAHMNGTGQEELKDADLDKLEAFLEQEADSGKNRVVFIQTHWPLHYAYNHAWRTTKNAGRAIDLCNSYSDRLDICWVWGHNHRHDANRHQFRTRNYVMQISSTEYKTIRFNYFNAGCLNENGAEQDNGPSGSNYGPGYCLEAKIVGDQLILDYGHVTGAYPDPTQAKFDHNADLLYVEPIQEARESHKEIQLVHYGSCEHTYVMTHTEPTCLDYGTNNYKCSKCGLEYHDDVNEPLGHDWDEGRITKQPTETEKGVKTFTCKRCGETKTKSVPRKGLVLPENVDFTDADSAGLYEIIGQTSAEQTEDGLVTSTTRNAIEPCNDQNSGSQATTPEDLIKVSVFDDWAATLTFEFDPASASNGYYQFFGFYAMEGEDYQNMAGIRGGDKAFQNFIRLDGAITADDDDISSSPGLDTAQLYWLRLEKSGDTYYCYRSDDGETFTEMFRYEDTGIDADYIVIDAYTGMTTGYKFTLKSLEFEEPEHVSCKHEYVETSVAPTCFMAGYTSYVCGICGTAKVVEGTPALGHEYKDGKCVRCGQPEVKSGGTLADTVTLGGKYVIVSNGYAMTNGEAGIVGTAATVDGDVLTSAVEDNMIWEFTEGSSDRGGGYTGYFLKNGSSDFILARASSGGSGSAPLNYNTYTAETAKSETKEYYCYWIVKDLEGGNKALFLYSDKGESEYAWAIRGGQTFDAPGSRVGNLDTLSSENPLKLYEITGEAFCKHEYDETVVAPTCYTKGYTTRTCKKCGTISVVNILEPMGHNFVGGYCTNCGEKEKEPTPPFRFDDVNDTSKFYYEPVYWAFNHKPQVTNGATDTTFNPDGACTRGHVVTFLWRAAGEPAPTTKTSPFTDLKESAFYYKAVLWAVEKGITTGASKTTFAPGKPCTRGQIVTFLWRFKNSPEPTSTENPFGDVKADGFYYKAVLWAVENNVTSGTGKGKFSPDKTCTRGQVVTFLYRATEG